MAHRRGPTAFCVHTGAGTVNVTCPNCGESTEAPPGTQEVTCPSCSHTFNVPGQAATVADDASGAETQMGGGAGIEEMDTIVLPTGTGPRIRVNCPQCHKELELRPGEEPGDCPRCGASLRELGAQEITVSKEDAPSDVQSARTIADRAPLASSREAAPEGTAIDWMREHFSKDYEIEDFIARGGMGAVYKARQKRPSREVALKVMLAGAFATPAHRRRFEREAQAVARLSHPAIVPVYEYGEMDGQPYFAMEYVEGLDLKSYVLREKLSREEICRLMVRVCDAIHYAHQHGVIHRDLKPTNIIVDRLKRPRILDFGLSRVMPEGGAERSMLTRSGDLLGTPRYMSPEQALGRAKYVDERADVYAIGAILFELVVGVLPYPLEHAQGLRLFQVFLQAQAVKPSNLLALFPRDLEIILLKAVEKDPEQRYRTAEELARDLENFLAERPISARPATVGYRLSMWAQRNRKVLIPAVISLLVIAILSGVFLNIFRQQRLKETEQGITIGTLRTQEELRRLGEESTIQQIAAEIAQGSLAFAQHSAQLAKKLWPDSKRAQAQPTRVRRAAAKRVASALATYWSLIRAQDYDAAHQKADALLALAGALPAAYGDLKEQARKDEAAFLDDCWKDQREALELAYVREDALNRIDNFIRRFPESPHLEQAEKDRQAFAEKPPDYFLEKHEEAFQRAIEGYRWAEAEDILSSARKTLAAAKAQVRDKWAGQFKRSQEELNSIIRPATAARLKRLRLESPVNLGLIKGMVYLSGKDLVVVAPQAKPVTFLRPDGWEVADRLPPAAGNLRSLAASADESLLALGYEEGTVTLWNPESRQMAHELAGQKGYVRSVSFSPDGTVLATADQFSLLLWDVKSGQKLKEQPSQARRPACFWPGGAFVAARTRARAEGEGKDPDEQEWKVGLWDVELGMWAPDWFLPTGPALALAFSPEGRLLAEGHNQTPGDIATDEMVGVWEVETGKKLTELPIGRGQINDIEFSPDGRLLCVLLGGFSGKHLTLWEADTGRMLTRSDLPTSPYAAVFDPQQRRLIVGLMDGKLCVYGIPAATSGGAADGEGK